MTKPVKPKVTIGIPTSDYFTVPKKFTVSLSEMICYSYEQGIVSKIDMLYTTGPMTAGNRNLICDMNKHEYVFMVDADMTFKPETLADLITVAEANQNSVVTGIGHMGYPPYAPALYYWPNCKGKPAPLHSWRESAPFEIDAAGSFGMLIPRHILTVLGEGAFSHIPDFYKDEKTAERRELRHDLAFCKRLKDNGFKLLAVPWVEFGHLRPQEIGREQWEKNKLALGEKAFDLVPPKKIL